MNKEHCLSWYLAGAVFGICIASYIVPFTDVTTSYKLLLAETILNCINLVLLIYVIIKSRK